MKVLAFIVGATIFEAVGDAVMRIALHYHVMPGRLVLFASATVLLVLYGASLNLAPVKFAEATGIYIASLFIMFQIVNYLFFRHVPSPGVLVGGTLIVAGAGIVYYGIKDLAMAKDASCGFMIWDGKSKGTLTNVINLLGAQKKVLLYHSPKKHFFTVRTTGDLHHALDASGIKNVDSFLASLQTNRAESDHPEFAFRL